MQIDRPRGPEDLVIVKRQSTITHHDEGQGSGKDRRIDGAGDRSSSDDPHGMATTTHEVLPVIPGRLFDAEGKPKPLTELGENEAAAIAEYEFHGEIQGSGGPGKAVTVKFKFLDRLTALALIGKACHWYADRQEDAASVGAPIQNEIVVRFVRPSRSPEEAYRRMVTDR